MQSETILIVEDDPNTAALVAAYLEREGYATVIHADGDEGLAFARDESPLMVILDVMLPSRDGWDICRSLRSVSDVPILMLTAREEEIDRVLGLSLGADDYVVKPFSPRELVERVKAILRRTRNLAGPHSKILVCGDLQIDYEKHKVSLEGRIIELTPAEFKILYLLMSHPGQVFSREQLLGEFYPNEDAVIDRVIDVHVGKLRQKLDDHPVHSRFIETVRGIGYRFVESESNGTR
ncbi:MAG: DNA-binding response regulator [Desulfuromonas sp.]|nr:MAG: DNA-binding response regulator [Desulfuromonas sp.]